MNVVRWEPFGDLMNLRHTVDRLFEDTLRPMRLLDGIEGGYPALDVYESEESLVVQAALPGVKPDAVDINITGNTLVVQGESKAESEVKRDAYHRQERRYGAFRRSVSLPAGLRLDKAEAAFENGVLTITLPKAEAVRPRTIKIKAGKTIEGEKS